MFAFSPAHPGVVNTVDHMLVSMTILQSRIKVNSYKRRNFFTSSSAKTNDALQSQSKMHFAHIHYVYIAKSPKEVSLFDDSVSLKCMKNKCEEELLNQEEHKLVTLLTRTTQTRQSVT